MKNHLKLQHGLLWLWQRVTENFKRSIEVITGPSWKYASHKFQGFSNTIGCRWPCTYCHHEGSCHGNVIMLYITHKDIKKQGEINGDGGCCWEKKKLDDKTDLEEFFNKHLHTFDPGKVTTIYLGRLSILITYKVANVLVLPVTESHRTTFTIASIIIGGDDCFIARMKGARWLHLQLQFIPRAQILSCFGYSSLSLPSHYLHYMFCKRNQN